MVWSDPTRAKILLRPLFWNKSGASGGPCDFNTSIGGFAYLIVLDFSMSIWIWVAIMKIEQRIPHNSIAIIMSA